jgi:proline iminopeptidase
MKKHEERSMSEEVPPGVKVTLEELVRLTQDHLRRYIETDGAEGHMWDSAPAGGPGLVPTLLLTTTGRKSGEKRVMPLVYGKTDAGYLVVGSRGGAPTHPAWYLNVMANPLVDVQVAREKLRARARVATGAEHDALFAHMATVFPPYAGYQARTDRQLPVVVLEPIDD